MLVILVVLVELSRILTVVIELPGMLIVAILEGVLIAVTAPRSLKKPYVPLWFQIPREYLLPGCRGLIRS